MTTGIGIEASSSPPLRLVEPIKFLVCLLFFLFVLFFQIKTEQIKQEPDVKNIGISTKDQHKEDHTGPRDMNGMKFKNKCMLSPRYRYKSIGQYLTIIFLHSSIVSFWITLACSKERKYHIFDNIGTPEMCSIYIILDGIEGCMRIYCTRHDDIHRAGTAR